MARGGSSVTFACGAAQQGRTGRSHATRAREPPASTQRTGGGRGQIRQCLWVHTLSHSVPSRYGRAKAGLVVSYATVARGVHCAVPVARGPRGGPAHGPGRRGRARSQMSLALCGPVAVGCRGRARFATLRFILFFDTFAFWGVSRVTRLGRLSELRKVPARAHRRTTECAPVRTCDCSIQQPACTASPRPESPDGDYRFFGLTFPPRSSRGAPPRRTAQGTLGLTAASATLHLHSSTAEKETQNPNRE